MGPGSALEAEREELEKCRELYYLSKEVFQEELGRSERIEAKASRYLTILTLMLGAFAFFGERVLDSFVPPENTIEWGSAVLTCVLLLALVAAWFALFGVLKVREFRKVPIDIEHFKNHELSQIYLSMSRGFKENLDLNRLTTDPVVTGRIQRLGIAGLARHVDPP